MNKKLFGLVAVLVMVAGSAAPAHAASLTTSQIQAILNLLSSFGADQSVINNVSASLNGTSVSSGTAFCHNFNNDLTVGNSGDEVSALNQALAASGIDTTGNTALFTENNAGDVVAFQSHYGIRQTGYVGPLTRAKLNVLYGCHNDQTTTITGTVSASGTTPATTQSTTPAIQPTATTQPTTLTTPVQVSPVISYVLSPNNPENQKVLLAGQSATIVGTNFPTTFTPAVNIGAYSTSGQTSADGTQLVFTVPASVSSGTYDVYLSTQKGTLTNRVSVTVGTLAAPAVDLKINGTDGPATSMGYGDAINLSWTSTGAFSCAASSNNSSQYWSGSKSVSGNESLSMPAANVAAYILTCTGANGTTASDQVLAY